MNLAFPPWTRSWLGMWSVLRREPLGIDETSFYLRQDPDLPRTDREGRFSLAGVLGGHEPIVVDHPDFALQSVPLPDQPAETVTDLQVILEEARRGCGGRPRRSCPFPLIKG